MVGAAFRNLGCRIQGSGLGLSCAGLGNRIELCIIKLCNNGLTWLSLMVRDWLGIRIRPWVYFVAVS